MQSITLATWIFGLTVNVDICPGIPHDFLRLGFFFRRRSQYNEKTPSDSFFEVAVQKQRNAVQHLSASTRTELIFLASESFPWLWSILKWLVESLPMILPILVAFGTSLQQITPPIRNLRNFLFSTAIPVLDIKITALEALKPLTTRFFTKISLTVRIWEHSISLSRSFLRIEAEHQNFPQMSKIWLENWLLLARINLWCTHKFTNVVLSSYWQMSKLTMWHFWSANFDQHLPLQPSIKNGESKVVHLIKLRTLS